MLTEVKTAVGFLTHVLLQNVGRITLDKIESFASALEARLCARYSGHWFPELPAKGSGFRCIRINSSQMDPLLAAVGRACGIPNLAVLLPSELTLWIDPDEVALRIGENGSVGVLYSSDSSDSGDSDADSVSSSPSTSPTPLSSSPTPPPTRSAAVVGRGESPRPCSATIERSRGLYCASPSADLYDTPLLPPPPHHALVGARHGYAMAGPMSCAADVMYVSCKEQQLRSGGVGRRQPAFNAFAAAAYVSS